MPAELSVLIDTAITSPESGSRPTNSASRIRIVPPLSIRSSAPTSWPSNLDPGGNLYASSCLDPDGITYSEAPLAQARIV